MSKGEKVPQCGCCGQKFDTMTAVFRHIKNSHMDDQDEIPPVKLENLAIEKDMAENISSLFDKSPSLQAFKRPKLSDKSQATFASKQSTSKESDNIESANEQEEEQVILISDDDTESEAGDKPPMADDYISEENKQQLQQFVVEMVAKDPAHICDVARRINVQEDTVKLWLGHIVVASEFPPESILQNLSVELSLQNKIELLSYFECHPNAENQELREFSKELDIPAETVIEWFSHHRIVCKRLWETVMTNRTSDITLPEEKAQKLKSVLRDLINPTFADYNSVSKSIQWSVVDVITWCKKNGPVYKVSGKRPKFGKCKKTIVKQFLQTHPNPTTAECLALSKKLLVSLPTIQEWISRTRDILISEEGSTDLSKGQEVNIPTQSTFVDHSGKHTDVGAKDKRLGFEKKGLTLSDKGTLSKLYKENPRPSIKQMRQYAAQLHVKTISVSSWFRHRHKKQSLPYLDVAEENTVPGSHHGQSSSAAFDPKKSLATSSSLEVMNQFYRRCKSPEESDIQQMSNVLNIHPDAVKINFNHMRHTHGLDWIRWPSDKEEFSPKVFEVLNRLYTHTSEPTSSDVSRLANLLQMHGDAIKLYINRKRTLDRLPILHWDTMDKPNDQNHKLNMSNQKAISVEYKGGISTEQRYKLIQFYKFKKFPSAEDVSQISSSTGLSTKSVKHWFYHHRRQNDLKATQPIAATPTNMKSKDKRNKSGGKLTKGNRQVLNCYYEKKKYPTEEEFKRYSAELGASILSIKLFFYHKREKDGLVQIKQRRMTRKPHFPFIKTEPDLAVAIKQEKDQGTDNSQKKEEATVCITSLCGVSSAIRAKLKAYFRAQNDPSDTELGLLAQDLKVAPAVVAAWFIRERSLVFGKKNTVDDTNDSESTVSCDEAPALTSAVPVEGPYSKNPGVLTVEPLHVVSSLEGFFDKATLDASEKHNPKAGHGKQNVSTDAKVKKKLTPEIRSMLNSMYEKNPNACQNKKDMAYIAGFLGLTTKQVTSFWHGKNTQARQRRLGVAKKLHSKPGPSSSLGSSNLKSSSLGVLPHQEFFLKLKFQSNSNPSIDELEAIAKEVQLDEMIVLKWFHQEKQNSGNTSQAAGQPPVTLITPQTSNVSPSSMPLEYQPPLVYTAPQHNQYFPSSCNFPPNIDPRLPILDIDYSDTGNLQEPAPSSSQMNYFEAGPSVVNTENVLHDYPMPEQSKETEILVPLNKVARITPFDGSARKLINFDNQPSNPITTATTEGETCTGEDNLLFGSSEQDKKPSQLPLNPVQPLVVPGSCSSVYPVSLTKLPPHTATSTAGLANLSTSSMGSNSESQKLMKSQPGKVAEVVPQSTVPCGEIVVNQNLLSQGTGNINQFNLNNQDVITIDDSD